jgi:RNA polymerase sigma-70 factor (ECF subfamily)
MTIEANRAKLLDLLLAGYDELKRRLARKLGSADLASDALHDTYVKLNTNVATGPIKSPNAYLFRVAVRLASDRRKSETRRVNFSDIDPSFDFVDEAPDPARIVEARSDIEALKRGMMELPKRRREMLIAAFLEETPYPILAERFGVTVRTIQSELKLGLLHCAKKLDRDLGVRMPSRKGRIASAPWNAADEGLPRSASDDAADNKAGHL